MSVLDGTVLEGDDEAAPSSRLAAQEFALSEKFVSLQGEGVSMGKPSAFVRLMGCNLSCGFCDTPYTWDVTRYDLAAETQPVSFAELSEWLLRSAPGRVIWTGGEPMIHQQKLARFFPLLDAAFEENEAARLFVEVETNGTIAPKQELFERVDQWNVSPKLAFGGDALAKRKRLGALEKLLATERAYFKFVVQDAADVDEVEALCAELSLPNARVLLMPEATRAETLRERMGWVSRSALERGFGYSHRLHLELYGGVRGT